MKTILTLLFMALVSVVWAQQTKIKPGIVTTITINPEKMNQLTNDYALLNADMKELQSQQEKIQTMLLELQSHNVDMKVFIARLQDWEKKIDSTGSNAPSLLLVATKKMQETQMLFNLQYLQLQSQMQHENLSYTAISNIMKTKHDTVKNSISNVR